MSGWEKGLHIFPLLGGESLSVLKNLYLWLFAAVILTVTTAVLTTPRVFGFARSAPLKDISPGSGYLYLSPVSRRIATSAKETHSAG